MTEEDDVKRKKTRKQVTIFKDQDEKIKEEHLNLSSFIREKLDDWIENLED